MEPQPSPTVAVSGTHSPVVVMGVSGSGKSTVGAALARRMAAPYLDSDTLHPPENVAKMSAGEPLTDADRYPWLERVGSWLAENRRGVVACSALKRAYRDQLRRHCPLMRFLHLHGTPALLTTRLNARSGHFMPAALLQSQFDALEPLGADEHGVVVELGEDQDADEIVDAFLASGASACGGS